MTSRIDAHQHFWNPRRGDYGWLTPELAGLYRPFGAQDLAPLLDAAGIQGTVAVQCAPSVAETEYLLGIADATPWVLGVVGWVDFADPGQLDALDRLARHPLLKGFRAMIQDMPDPEWILRPELDWAFRALVAHDLAFEALVRPAHLPALARLIERHPGLRVVIDHAAKPPLRDGDTADWARDIARIARHSGALCKLSGLATLLGPGWTAEALQPTVDHLLDTFGPGRLMWGSDWPYVTLASSYQRWADAAADLVTACSAGEQLAIFGGTAAAFYRLPG